MTLLMVCRPNITEYYPSDFMRSRLQLGLYQLWQVHASSGRPQLADTTGLFICTGISSFCSAAMSFRSSRHLFEDRSTITEGNR